MMKRFFLLTILAVSTMGAATPDRRAELKARMDKLQDTRDDLRDALDAKDGAKAATLSRDIAQLLHEDEPLWQTEKFEEVRRINQATIQLAERIQSQSSAGEIQGALESYTALQKSCASCHDRHPEQQLP